MQTVLAAVLLTPEAVFRFEVGDGKLDRLGRVRLAGGVAREAGVVMGRPDCRTRRAHAPISRP